MFELAGFIATTLVFTSFLFADLKKVRILNLIGSFFFVFYGFGIGAFWTAIMNLALIFVQCYQLNKLTKE